MAATYSNLHWVVVATQVTKPCLNYFSYTQDAGRACRGTYEDLRTEFKKRWDQGQKIGIIGATTDEWYMTFVRGGVRRGGAQTVKLFHSYDALVKAWEEDKGVITQLAARAGQILAIFEPLHRGEQAGLFSVRGGSLDATDLRDAKDRNNRNIIAATYFEKENRWIFVLSTFESCTEKWRVDDTLNRAFIKDNLDAGFIVTTIVASPSKWFILMQKSAVTQSMHQTLHLTHSNPNEFETEKWKEHFVITAATGNSRYRSPQSNAVAVRSPGRAVSPYGASRPGSAAAMRVQQAVLRDEGDGLAFYFSSLDIALTE